MKIFSTALFAKSCPLCLSAINDTVLCRRCLDSLPPLGYTCRICAAPIARHAGQICRHCAVGVPFDQVVALSSYAPPMSDLICRLKYHKQLDVAKVLGTLLADHVKLHHQTLPELLLAVPLHKTRLWQRGFNQSVEIAA